MGRQTQLDKYWQNLMGLCEKERAFQADNSHPKLLRYITNQIEQLAEQMGFTPRQIQSREFRAERDGDRILKIFVD